MGWPASAIREFFSLFVDDVYFALALVVWIALGIMVVPHMGFGPEWNGPLLFLGFVTIFVAGVWNAARGKGRIL